jgi:pyruvate/2-oxoglutarate dehydrogenase complex dihydrolipoamide dehydrogenase (E3) component
MPAKTRFDILIIGGGQAGIRWRMPWRRPGKESRWRNAGTLGGSCVNFGCTPTGR